MRIAVALAVAALVGTAAAFARLPVAERADAGQDYVGNDACRPCHAALVDSYSRTAMARTSGPATPGTVIEGGFTHELSGVVYRIEQRPDAATLEYSRVREPTLNGSVRLDYYVGSNTRGRTYLFAVDGFLYQSPVNYYAERRVWDMSPGYQQERHLPLNHPVDRTCLFCHASQIQHPVRGTANQFAGRPFLQAGVGCERCHGPGAAHVRDPRAGTIVNPARLAPGARDSVCMQCHLEGLSRIAKAGRSLLDYRPGDLLGDFVTAFVAADGGELGRGAVSHVESLAASRCKQASRGRLACTTCHDPHVPRNAATRVATYRTACLGCHQPLAAGHHPEQQDCTACHMPRRDSADVSHVAVTDHRILRHPSAEEAPSRTGGISLVAFGGNAASARDLGLAYAEIEPRAGQKAVGDARRELERAAADGVDDAEALTALAYLRQRAGDNGAAEPLYRRALAKDPDSVLAAANLGVLLATSQRLAEALPLWTSAFERAPHRTDLGVNLAMGRCLAGDAAGAKAAIARALRHNPDSEAARTFENALDREPERCRNPG
jgi:predicted CXXCH cytochrome family protein